MDHAKTPFGLTSIFIVLTLASCQLDKEKAWAIAIQHKDEHEQLIINQIRKVPVDWILSDGIFYKKMKAGDSLCVKWDDGEIMVFRASKQGYCRIVSDESAKYQNGILYVSGTTCWTDVMY